MLDWRKQLKGLIQSLFSEISIDRISQADFAFPHDTLLLGLTFSNSTRLLPNALICPSCTKAMSFIDIGDKFDLVAQHFSHGIRTIHCLSAYFQILKKGYEGLTSALERAGLQLARDLPENANMDTLTTALNAMTVHQKRIVEQHLAFTQGMQLEIVEPLEMFLEHFTSTNDTCINNGNFAFSQLTKARSMMTRCKESYYEACAACERVEQLVDLADSRDVLERAQRNLIQARTVAKSASERYMNAVDTVNKEWDDYDKLVPGVMESLQQGDESRIHFLKYTLEKFFRLVQKMNHADCKVYTDLNSIVTNISSSIDIRVFVDGLRNKSGSGTQRERFAGYEELRKLQKQESEEKEDDYLRAEGGETDPETLFVKKVVIGLLPKVHRLSFDSPSESELSENSDISSYDTAAEPEKLAQMFELLHTQHGRQLFLEVMDSRKYACQLTQLNIGHLASLFMVMLSALQDEGDRDPAVFFKIVMLTQVFYYETDTEKVYLSLYVSNHPIWAEFSRWQQAIEWATATRVASDRESIQKLQKARYTPKSRGVFRALKLFASKLPPVFQKDLSEEKVEKSTVFMVLSQFSFYMLNLTLPLDLASEVVLACCYKAHLDSERVCILLAELQANQPEPDNGRKKRKDTIRSLKRREKERLTWSEMLPLGCALVFLNNSELANLLCVSKSLHRPILELVLLTRPVSAIARSKIWSALLTPYAPSADFHSELQALTHQPLSRDIDDVIAIDVIRCFQNSPDITSECLSSLLRAYAHFNPLVGYCQGMNYVMGTLYILHNNESAAFLSMAGLVNKYQMSPLFYTQLPKLKLFFYQLDRLIGINLPTLHKVFTEEMISSSHFSSSWFITLFASLLQKKRDMLLSIWDQFLVVSDM